MNQDQRYHGNIYLIPEIYRKREIVEFYII